MEGTVKTIHPRGFGFIGRANAADIFFHATDLIEVVFDERLIELPVTFDEVSTEKGPRARNVRPVN